MNPEAAFEAWAPPAALWSVWAKPLLFALAGRERPAPAAEPPRAWDVTWAPPAADRAVLIVEAPGRAAADLGLALAGRGFRPVPLFNGVPHPAAVVPVGDLAQALLALAEPLAALALPPDAPPAFLLDSRRRQGAGALRPGRFDNRWLVFPQDFPSAARLLSHGLRRACLGQAGGGQPQEDLAHVLRRWQQAGMDLVVQDLDRPGPPQPLRVRRPRGFRWAWYRWLALLGFRRNSAGGFGGPIPLLPEGPGRG
jgi:hypothetical protein